MMELETVLHMNKGRGKTSYALNSRLQETVISKAKPLVQDSVVDFFAKNLPECLTMVDLGCSSGPNTLVFIHEVIDAIVSLCKRLGRRSPEFQIFLNDLVGNDFNTIFKSIPDFKKKLKREMGSGIGPCFISGMPGSIYGRLFPSETLHFVHSSYCLHFLSKVPPGIGNTNGNIYLAKASPSHVLNAYLTKYQKDFTLFLSSRSEEIVPGGRMVLTLIGRRSSDPTSTECCQFWELLAQSFREMVSEGVVDKAKLDEFNMPQYFPSIEELTTVIQEQGSFNLDFSGMFDVNWDTSITHRTNDLVLDKKASGRNVSIYLRAVLESMIVNHFGVHIIENLFEKYAKHLGEYMAEGKGYYVNHVVCMSKKIVKPGESILKKI